MDIDNENATLLPIEEGNPISGGNPISNPIAPRSVRTNNNTPRTNNNNNSCCSNLFCTKDALNGWLLFLFWCFLIVVIILLKYESDQRYNLLLTKYVTLQTQIDNVETNNNARYTIWKNDLEIFQTKESLFESKTLEILLKQNITNNQLLNTISQHDKALIRLSNGTSNADVLDKLSETKQQIDGLLVVTQDNIKHDLTSAQRNVTIQLDKSRTEFQRTEQSVKDHLDETVTRMKLVVNEATSNIYQVQKNVTNEIHSMSVTLSKTVEEVNKNVEDAQSIIKEDVKTVRSNIDQYVAVTNQRFAAENDFVKYQLAGLFTLLSCLIFLWHLTQHMRHYSKPDIQNRIMGILWMVPIYGVTSWLSMVSTASEPYLAAFRDCFESYVVYTFVGFLIAVLSDGLSRPQLILKLAKEVEHERKALERFNNNRNNPTVTVDENAKLVAPKEHLIPPCPCCYRRDPISTARRWLNQCQLLAMQFVFVKPLLTIIPLILNVSQVYNVDEIPAFVDNNINWQAPKLYVLLLQNISVGLAFYGLLSFYHGVERDLEWCEPWPKFLCIKGVVFLTFWQSVTIQIMGNFGLVGEKSASQISNLLICIEMLIASIAHFYIFPYQEWAPGYQRAKQKSILLRDTMAFGDFLKDMRAMFTKDSLNQSTLEPDSPTKSILLDDHETSMIVQTPLHHHLILDEDGGGKATEMTATNKKEKTKMTDQEALIREELQEKLSLLMKLSDEDTTKSKIKRVASADEKKIEDDLNVGDYYQSSPSISPRSQMTINLPSISRFEDYKEGDGGPFSPESKV